jgi:hypothetical protein
MDTNTIILLIFIFILVALVATTLALIILIGMEVKRRPSIVFNLSIIFKAAWYTIAIVIFFTSITLFLIGKSNLAAIGGILMVIIMTAALWWAALLRYLERYYFIRPWIVATGIIAATISIFALGTGIFINIKYPHVYPISKREIVTPWVSGIFLIYAVGVWIYVWLIEKD